jgi:alpha-tubulin suppressor-like RCC1 family protein
MPENIVSILSNARSIAGGFAHSLAVASDGTLWGWGLNGNYQVGDGTNINRNAPVQIGSSTDWVAVAAGDYHSIALNSSGDAYGWGKNTNGQCGTGGGATVLSPTIITMPETVSINKIEAYGDNSLFGETLNLKVYGCGANTSVQIVYPQSAYSYGTPVRMSLFDGADLFAIMRGLTVAVKDGSVAYQAGQPVSFAVPGESFISLSASEDCVFAVNAIGEVWGFAVGSTSPLSYFPDGDSWGRSGHSIPAPLWQQRTDAPAAVKVAAGREHLFIIGQDGYLYSYGDNTYGQLSRTTSTDTDLRTITKIEAAGSGWTNVACGSYHTLATLGT